MASRCEHTKTDGTRCKAFALPGRTKCYFHDPANRPAREAASRRGGQNRRRAPTALPADSPDLPLGTVADLKAALGRTVNDVRKGGVDVRVGNCLSALFSVLAKVLESADLEARILALEAARK